MPHLTLGSASAPDSQRQEDPSLPVSATTILNARGATSLAGFIATNEAGSPVFTRATHSDSVAQSPFPSLFSILVAKYC